jgi:hypothetical protein
VLDGVDMTVFVDATGLDGLKHLFDQAPAIANTAAKLAINQTVERKGMKLARDAMLQQVAWPSGYLNEADSSGDKRFRLAYKATDTRLEAGIVGRQRATSLARFTGLTSPPARRTPISVRVNPGVTTELKRSFLLRGRSGNLLLGVRLKPGEVLENTIGAKLIKTGPMAGVALLYGPSVDQVFRSVAVQISPPLLDALTTEFLRQFERLLRNA